MRRSTRRCCIQTIDSAVYADFVGVRHFRGTCHVELTGLLGSAKFEIDYMDYQKGKWVTKRRVDGCNWFVLTFKKETKWSILVPTYHSDRLNTWISKSSSDSENAILWMAANLVLLTIQNHHNALQCLRRNWRIVLKTGTAGACSLSAEYFAMLTALPPRRTRMWPIKMCSLP